MVADNDPSKAPAAIPTLVPNKSDTERAAGYREALMEALQPTCEIMTKAHRDGINISWTVQPDAMGRFFVAQLATSKELK